MDTSEKLMKVWPIVKWLDDSRWATPIEPIPGSVHMSLTSSEKVLTHWLAYITDQQRSYQDVWQYGGPIFSEIVKAYRQVKNESQVMPLLLLYSKENPDIKKKVDVFTSKNQTINGYFLKYTPRFGTHLVSIARTLYHLTRFDNNIAQLFHKHSDFILVTPRYEDDSPVKRMAFLLHLISYDQTPGNISSFHTQHDQLKDYLREDSEWINAQLSDSTKLEFLYRDWLPAKRYHKRLWAAIRDYVKLGSLYSIHFSDSLNLVRADRLSEYLNSERQSVLCELELPGDIWNSRFNQFLFNSKLNQPSQLRYYYKQLRSLGRINEEYYPEQFDVSFDFAPRMCDLGQERFCPFKNGTKLIEYCINYENSRLVDKMCPVTKILCGYEIPCSPNGCPIADGSMFDLCSGCAFKIDQ